MPGSTTLAKAVLEIAIEGVGFGKGLDDAQKQIASFGKGMESFGKDARKVGEAILPFSAAIAGLGVGSLKAAVDFESSFAGIRKTVGDATDSLGNLTAVGRGLEQGMRNMALEIPTNVDELNKIGEAAGQLGIKSENILGFTRVMANLGVATNLSAEEAATALARLANITQMPQDQFDRLGSTIVALGNNMATTESDIAAFGLRIAGAGHQVGLSEAQILSIGAALSSVGIEAEAGGSAISKVMINMALAVQQGGKELTQFAGVAGVSSAQFKQQFQTDAAGALTAFITGLGNMQGQGKSALGVLDEMGITEVRMRDALLRSAGAGDLLAKSLDIGTKAWTDNNALTKEAEQRYGTTASQLQLLWNQIKDVAITLGDAMLPVLKTGVEVLKSWVPTIQAAAQWFAELSPGMQSAVVIIGGLVAALGPALIAFGAIATAIGAALPILATVGAAIGVFVTGPIALIVAAVAGVVLAWKNWDTITGIAQAVYTGVKTWLVDRFAAVVDAVKAKVDAVTGFFGDMYDKVIGHSFVPDMIDGIATQFARLDSIMVQPTFGAASQVQGSFASMLQTTSDIFGALDSLVDGRARGISGNLSKSFSEARNAVQGILRGMSGDITGWVDAAIAAFKSVKAWWDMIAGLFDSEETKKVNKPRDAFQDQFGGFEGLAKALTDALAGLGEEDAGNKAGALLRAMNGARNEADWKKAQQAIADVFQRAGKPVRQFADGGFVLGPTLGLIGEAGPEAVVPLNRFGSILGQQQPIEITVISQLDGYNVARSVVRHMPRALHHAGLA
jgi:TP901 family phage tail tape measure protein